MEHIPKDANDAYSHFPTTKYNTAISKQARPLERDREPRSEKVLKVAGSIALFGALHGVSLLATDIQQGIQEGKALVAEDQPVIHEIYNYPADGEFSHHATVVLTGLGTKDASETAASLDAHREMGSVYAVEYSNKDLNTQHIAEKITHQAQQDGVTHLSFDGYSMGGPIAVDVASQLQSSNEALQVVSVVFNSSPIGDDSLTARSARSVEVMERVLSLHRDLVYYEKGRVGIELIARSEHYIHEVASGGSEAAAKIHGLDSYSFNGVRYQIDYSALRHELNDIRQKMAQPNTAKANLIHNQASVLKNDIEDKITRLDKDTLVVYTRSASHESDTVVDVAASERNVVSMLSEGDRPFKVLRERIQHANPVERKAEYDRMIRLNIQPDVMKHLLADSLHLNDDEPVSTRESRGVEAMGVSLESPEEDLN